MSFPSSGTSIGCTLYLVFLACSLHAERARDWGMVFEGTPGSGNAITDVEGVWVGHCTLVSEEGKGDHGPVAVRTGVTAILPRGATYGPVWAACEKLNGNGEMTGTTWIDESGFLEEPVLLTNTHSVGAVYEASIQWRRQRGYHPQDAGQGWASLPVVAETWDGRLNDIHGHHIRAQHVFAALDQAHAGRVEEGNVGGGTGMVCHGFKGGIGTASRLLPGGDTLGVLVQTNYGRREDLQITGVPVGSRIRGYEMSIQQPSLYQGNSIIVVIATDAPLLPHQLKRVAQRASLGIGRTGGYGAHSSGDLFLAFSTARISGPDHKGVHSVAMLANHQLDALFLATIQAVEESILNALVAAETMTGMHGNKVHALPRDQVRSLLRQAGARKRVQP